jgi:hypothetical protein
MAKVTGAELLRSLRAEADRIDVLTAGPCSLASVGAGLAVVPFG